MVITVTLSSDLKEVREQAVRISSRRGFWEKKRMCLKALKQEPGMFKK